MNPLTTSRAALRSSVRHVRPEIQALRTIAVLGVLLYHLWPTRLTGGFVGVDVFFVVSGFLITDHLLREISRDGKVSLARFWARRARRLLPASLLVLAVTALATWAWVPEARWSQFGGEFVASALYVENWALAAQSVDYMALSNLKSPVQHFWSLGVEEQFYILWPLVLVAGHLAARRLARNSFLFIAVLLSIVTIASLAYSIILTDLQPTVAYFSTFTRAWEFGAGALLAIAGKRSGPLFSGALAVLGSWSGFVLVGVSMLMFDAATPFPSFTAALPVLGTLLVIASGSPTSRLAPTGLVSLKPVQFIGDVSYGTYLWHWPLIVLLPFVMGAPLTIWSKVTVLLVSILLGWLSKKLIEDPIRQHPAIVRSRPTSTLVATAGAMAVVVAAVMPLAAHRIAPPEAPVTGALEDCYGALAMLQDDCGPVEQIPLRSSLSSFAADLPSEEIRSCEFAASSGDFRRCEFGSSDPAGPRVALIGDSHATRWVEALTEVVTAESGSLSTFLVSGCASVTSRTTGSAWGFDAAYAEQCRIASERMLSAVEEDLELDTVILTDRTRLYVTDNTEFHPLTVDMVAETIERLKNAGKRVIVLEDPPEMNAVPPQGGGSAPDCLSNAPQASDCSLPAAAAQFSDPMVLGAERANAEVVGLDDLFCDTERCMSQIGGVVVYSDDNHLTRSFAMSLVGPLQERLRLTR